MIAVLGNKNRPLKLGDKLQFGIYNSKPIKWHVIDVKPLEHKALLIADSCCGDVYAKFKEPDIVSDYYTKFKVRTFSEAEQSLILSVEILPYNSSLSADELKFFPFGDENAVKYWAEFYDASTACVIGLNGEILYYKWSNSYDRDTFFIRPLIWVRY